MNDTATDRASKPVTDFDVIVVGAGFAGLYMLHQLRSRGRSVRVIEAGAGLGGTWFWNRYPGARCDVPSMEYSFGFDDDLQQQWDWTERYASQPEILDYLNHVADRFDLTDDIQFETRVTAATYAEAEGRWEVRTDRGDELHAQFLVMATGCLSSTNRPDIPGRDSFAGDVFHTGQWPPNGVDVAGRRVGIIGTGSSGVQTIPLLAAQADHLTVFQRTATYVVPAANHDLDPQAQAATKAGYSSLRDRNRQMPVAFGADERHADTSALAVSESERNAEFERRWERGGLPFLGAFIDLIFDPAANETAADFVRAKIREIVNDPDVAEMLSPTTPIGCKRLCLGTEYYETFNRPDVRLVDVGDAPIETITPTGLTARGEHHELDTIVFATGFDAMTGALAAIDIVGTDSLELRDAWAAGPRTYLGLGVPGFPNLFTVSGPGSPSVLTNMVVSIEQHVQWIATCIDDVRADGHRTIEATPEAADAWVAHVNSIAGLTIYPTCNSWYLGANVPGKPRVFMPLLGFPPYVERCNAVAANGYDGFVLGD